MPRQRDAAAELSCWLVTLVTVAVQQDPASLTPEAWLNSKTIRAPQSKRGLLLFLLFPCPLSLLIHLLPEIYTNKPTLKATPHYGYALML